MNGFLLDTNVLSEFSQPNKQLNPIVKQWLQATGEPLFVSVLSLGEIHKGIEKLALGRHRTSLENWFDDGLRPIFTGRILPISEAVALRWASLFVSLQKQGKTPQIIDSLIAATALEYNLTMATRNVTDFENTGVSLVNPWTAFSH